MKQAIVGCVAAAGVLTFFGCAHDEKSGSAAPASRRVTGQFETFTGNITKTDEGYRFSPDDAPETLQRLTRADERANFEDDELHMRKYYGKQIVIRGVVAGNGWIARVQVIGQYVRSGESRGPTLTGPEPKAKKP